MDEVKAEDVDGEDSTEDGAEREISLSEYVHGELVDLINDPKVTSRLGSFLNQADALVILQGESQAQLPPLDWSKVFRKSYTLLMWLRPVVLAAQVQPESDNEVVDLDGVATDAETAGSASVADPTSSASSPTGSSQTRKILYRFSTHPDDQQGVGICCTVGEWHSVGEAGLLQTTLTAFCLPSTFKNQHLIQIPLLLKDNEWSLIGISHVYPYLKRPQWRVTVNGETMGSGELNYPVIDGHYFMQHNALLHNIVQGGVAVMQQRSNKRDEEEPASVLSEEPSYAYQQMEMHLASVALHPDIVSPQLQALVASGGPQLSLQSQGKILTQLPPIDNWSKGSSLDGPNVGVPIGVSGGALDLQRLSGRVYLYFGATHSRLLKTRILLPMMYLPGETDSTPKVGLVQPGVPERFEEEELPSIHLFGNVTIKHALSEFLLQCDNPMIDAQLSDTTKHLSVLLLEQGFVPACVLPFFLSQLPPAYGLDMQQNLFNKSLEYLYKLYTDDGAWAAQLVLLLADLIQFQGGRAQEQVLQGGILHCLCSSLRVSLLRAEALRVYSFDTLDTFMQYAQSSEAKEKAWQRPNHEESCPSMIPPKLIQASARLIEACCGTEILSDLTALLYIQRSSDLALTAVFGFALNFDLWGKSKEAVNTILKVLADRYANVQGGHILRHQLPVQSFLDLVRTRLQEDTHNYYVSFLLQHMLLSSLTNRTNISQAESDVAACMGALSDCPLGSVGAHSILSSLTNILQWCSSSDTDEGKLQILARLGRNLIMSQYHDVVAPMLLSRTVFCGERSMSAEKQGGHSEELHWEEDWRMALLLFAWVTSVAGAEGGAAARSTGSLLLASALAGSLKDCMRIPDKSRYIANLFLPTPAMAVLVRKDSSNWSYTDLLSDRLQVLMPLLPGLAVSLLSEEHADLRVLTEILSTVKGCFLRVVGGFTQNMTLDRQRQKIPSNQLAGFVAGAKEFVGPLVTVIKALEQRIRAKSKIDVDSSAVLVLKPSRSTRQRTHSHGSWVDIPSLQESLLYTPMPEGETEETAVSIATETLCEVMFTTMNVGSTEMSTIAWKAAVGSMKEALNMDSAITETDKKRVAQDILCRLVAMVLTKILSREQEWEMISDAMCMATARLCDFVEEKDLLALIPATSGSVSRISEDQILLLSALCDVLQYGREMTGWCQLVLPAPPEPSKRQNRPSALSGDKTRNDPSEFGSGVEGGARVASPTSRYTAGDITGSKSNNNRQAAPPDVPGASSRLLLPILQPSLRLLLLSFRHIISDSLVRIPNRDNSNLLVDNGEVDPTETSLLSVVSDELRETMTAAVVGLAFPNARDIAMSGLSSLRRAGHHFHHAEDAVATAACWVLFVAVVEELQARYEGERRRREQALADPFDDDDGGMRRNEIRSSNEVERMLVGSELVPSRPPQGKKSGNLAVEEIRFESDDHADQSNEDFVMFEKGLIVDESTNHTMGFDGYRGLGSTLQECSIIIQASTEENLVNDLKEKKVDTLLDILKPYLDTWDETAAKDAAESELVGMFDDLAVDASHAAIASGKSSLELRTSETAADAMSTYIEMASLEKARLSELIISFLPSRRYSCQAYTDRYCWAKYFEINFEHNFGIDELFERGISDGNRDIRSRLVTMPCNPQFKRVLPRHLDHGDDSEESPFIPSENDSLTPEKRESTTSDDVAITAAPLDTIHQSLMKAGNIEIIDITKKEVDESQHDLFAQDVLDSMTENDEDEEIYGDGSLGFPSRDDPPEEKPNASVEEDSVATQNEATETTDSYSAVSAATITTPESQHPSSSSSSAYHLVSSIYSHPPDNSASILSLMQAATARMLEKHFEQCLHVKAEGSRKCTMLLSATHLILEYDADGEGLFEGEMMAVHEEAERHRLITQTGGVCEPLDSEEEEIEERLERRQKEIASMRPKSIRWNLSELSHVYLRRYRLRDSALEMFFIPSGGTSYGGFGLFSPATSLFLDFGPGREGNSRRDEAAHAIMRRSPPQTIKQWPDKSNQFLHEQLSRLTMGWVEGRITNFDYLLHLNMLAGRSYNDLCQYPVMPWVLSNYTSEHIPDLTDPANFRDLSKPMGALNPERLEDFLDRFETFADPSIPPFMYGSHYSTMAGVVLHFLVRMHPFAGLHRQLQGGHFDVADRLFSSVPRTWDMCTGYSAAEVKELTPEWYCNPAFLKNSNRYKMGTSQDKETLGDVVLPPWAEKSAERFVEVMRNALESDICSEMLPDWIDLIFGRKQQGPEAIKANNVFFYLTYYGSVDVAAIEDEGLRQATELQIAHFGQCPMQLFFRPHVRRTIQIRHYQKLTFYQMLSAYTQGAGWSDAQRPIELKRDGSPRLFGEPLFLPFFSAPLSHWVHLDAPPPGPHADMIAVRLAGIDRCLAVDANGIFHSFRWAWKADQGDGAEDVGTRNQIDSGCFVAQRELPRFRTVPRLMHVHLNVEGSTIPAVGISKTLFASRSVLLVLSDGDGRGGLSMQLVDPAKAAVKGEALVSGVHSSRITCIAMDPIGTAAGHGGVGGELAIVGSADGNSSLWRFMSSHYLPLRPRTRMRGHGGCKIHAVALSSAINVCASISSHRLCIFSIGNGALIRAWSPPQDMLGLPGTVRTKTQFADTSALCLSVQGFVVAVCRTTILSEGASGRDVVTLHMFSLEGVSIGSKALESWRGVPRKITCTPDGTAIFVSAGRGVTIHRLSAITPLEFIDEWHVTESEELNHSVASAFDVDFGPSLMRPIVAAAALSSGSLRYHALPGISAWSERHKNRGGMNLGNTLGKPMGRLKNTFTKSFGFGKAAIDVGKDVAKEVTSDVKERGVGGFLSGTLFRKKNKDP